MRLGPLDRALALALMGATLSATGRVSEGKVLRRLHSDRVLGRLSRDAVCATLRQPTALRATGAMARPAGEGRLGTEPSTGPGGQATGMTDPTCGAGTPAAIRSLKVKEQRGCLRE